MLDNLFEFINNVEVIKIIHNVNIVFDKFKLIKIKININIKMKIKKYFSRFKILFFF